MAKKQSISLNSFVTRILLLAFFGFSFIAISVILIFFALFETKTILPANTGEIAAHETINELAKKETFSTDFDSRYFNYIYFDKKGTVISSSLKKKALKKVEKKYQNTGGDYAKASYLTFPDGSYCLFIWNYKTAFSNAWMRKHLPSPEVFFLGLIVLLLLFYFLFLIRFTSRTLRKRLSLVNHASSRIAKQQLEDEIKTKSGIKEFDNTLKSMEEMRVTLKSSLIEQWHIQQQKQQDLVALSHDIKTPLTIVSGNAELLIEDDLTESQKEVAQTILSSSKRALRYLTILQQLTNSEMLKTEKNTISLETLVAKIDESLNPLVNQKGRIIHYSYPEGLAIFVDVFSLVRALITIGENAITYSSTGDIHLSVVEKETSIYFSFEDTGPGFSREGLKHATDLFWQQEKSRTSNTNYGIGLSLAKRVAKSHGGSLVLENTNTGAKVTLIIEK